MSLLGIVLALVLLMALAYRGMSVLLLAPLMALLAALFSPDAPLLASYTQIFMPALGAFVVAFSRSFCWVRCLASSWKTRARRV